MTSFDDYVRALEQHCTDDEREMLEQARARALAQLDTVKRRIERRTQVEAFVALAKDRYGWRPEPYTQIVKLHLRPYDPFDHDGPCVELHPRKTGGIYFTVLPLKGEVWARTASEQDVTESPVPAYTNDEIFEYIDSFIDKENR